MNGLEKCPVMNESFIKKLYYGIRLLTLDIYSIGGFFLDGKAFLIVNVHQGEGVYILLFILSSNRNENKC